MAMGRIPEADGNIMNPITISREEHQLFVDHTADLVLRRLSEKGCVSFAPGNGKERCSDSYQVSFMG